MPNDPNTMAQAQQMWNDAASAIDTSQPMRQVGGAPGVGPAALQPAAGTPQTTGTPVAAPAPAAMQPVAGTQQTTGSAVQMSPGSAVPGLTAQNLPVTAGYRPPLTTAEYRAPGFAGVGIGADGKFDSSLYYDQTYGSDWRNNPETLKSFNLGESMAAQGAADSAPHDAMVDARFAHQAEATARQEAMLAARQAGNNPHLRANAPMEVAPADPTTMAQAHQMWNAEAARQQPQVMPMRPGNTGIVPPAMAQPAVAQRPDMSLRGPAATAAVRGAQAAPVGVAAPQAAAAPHQAAAATQQAAMRQSIVDSKAAPVVYQQPGGAGPIGNELGKM